MPTKPKPRLLQLADGVTFPLELAIVSYLLGHRWGVTADEFRRIAADQSPNQHAPSFTALSDAEVIVDSGQRRLTALGSPAIVWVLRGMAFDGTGLTWPGCTTLSGLHRLDVGAGACVYCGAAPVVAADVSATEQRALL